MVPGKLESVTDTEYPEFLKAPASLILFKIANCQKCDEFEPIVAEAAQRYADQIRFGMAKLHVPGACRDIKRRYRFESFPTTHFYKHGQLVHQEAEKLSPDLLSKRIQDHLL